MSKSPFVTNGANLPASLASDTARRVLVVEDNWETRMFMEYAMRRHYTVDSASTADEALQKAATTVYDICLVDIALSGTKDGIQVLKSLRAMPAYTRTPIVAVTAYALPGDRNRFLKAGFDAYLGKPFRQEDLLHLLERCIHSPDSTRRS